MAEGGSGDSQPSYRAIPNYTGGINDSHSEHLNNQRIHHLYECWKERLGCELYFLTKEGLQIPVHRAVCLMNSPVLRRQVGNTHHFVLPETRWECMYAIVVFMYGDCLHLRPDTVDEIEELASSLEIIGVADVCTRFRGLVETRQE